MSYFGAIVFENVGVANKSLGSHMLAWLCTGRLWFLLGMCLTLWLCWASPVVAQVASGLPSAQNNSAQNNSAPNSSQNQLDTAQPAAQTDGQTEQDSPNSTVEGIYLEGVVTKVEGDQAYVQVPKQASLMMVQTSAERAVRVGDRVQLYQTLDPDGQVVVYLSDYIRRPALYALAVLFLLVAVAVGRGKGLRAIGGMLLSLAVILMGMIPAILAGWNPVLVALLGSLGILLFSVYFVHGLNWTTTAALIGTLITSAITIGLASLMTYLAHLSGLEQEEALYLQQLGIQIDFKALLLGGVIIGALGAIVDSTIPQAAVVRELAHTNPNQSWLELYTRSMRVGLDHIGSLINTLVLAYVGSSLPMFVVFSIGNVPLSQTVNGEMIATALVQTMVGSIGLILAVPITALLAAFAFSSGLVPAPSHDELHAHHHHH